MFGGNKKTAIRTKKAVVEDSPERPSEEEESAEKYISEENEFDSSSEDDKSAEIPQASGCEETEYGEERPLPP